MAGILKNIINRGNDAIDRLNEQIRNGTFPGVLKPLEKLNLPGTSAGSSQDRQSQQAQPSAPQPAPQPAPQTTPQPAPQPVQAPKYDAAYYAAKSRIQFNFDAAKRQADQLDGIASRMEQTAVRDMENSMQMLAGGWRGENANAFLAKEEIIKNNILSSARELHAVASDIRTIARRLYEAEMEALRIATERKA